MQCCPFRHAAPQRSKAPAHEYAVDHAGLGRGKSQFPPPSSGARRRPSTLRAKCPTKDRKTKAQIVLCLRWLPEYLAFRGVTASLFCGNIIGERLRRRTYGVEAKLP